MGHEPRGQSRIRYSLPPPGFSESGIYLANATVATGKPLGFLYAYAGTHKMGQTESRARVGIFPSLRGLPTWGHEPAQRERGIKVYVRPNTSTVASQ